MCSRWSRQKDYWLLCIVTDEQLIQVILQYVMRYPSDHETILWLSSRGAKGTDKGDGLTETIALNYGNYVPRKEVRYDGRTA